MASIPSCRLGLIAFPRGVSNGFSIRVGTKDLGIATTWVYPQGPPFLDAPDPGHKLESALCELLLAQRILSPRSQGSHPLPPLE